MPKQPSVPRYRLHKARNCAVVTIRGRNFYLGAYDSPESKEKYARLIAEHFGNGHCAAVDSEKEQAAATINELILRYWTEHVEGYYVKDGKPSDRQYHIRLALAPLRKLYGRTLAKDFGPKKLKVIRNEILDEGMRTRGGLNRGYVNDHVGIIKRVFRWAVSEEVMPREIGPALCGQLDAVENLHKGKDPRVKEGRKIPSAPKSDIRKARRCMRCRRGALRCWRRRPPTPVVVVTPVAPPVMTDDGAGEIIVTMPATTPPMLGSALQHVNPAPAMNLIPGATDLVIRFNGPMPSGSRARALPSHQGRSTSI